MVLQLRMPLKGHSKVHKDIRLDKLLYVKMSQLKEACNAVMSSPAALPARYQDSAAASHCPLQVGHCTSSSG